MCLSMPLPLFTWWVLVFAFNPACSIAVHLVELNSCSIPVHLVESPACAQIRLDDGSTCDRYTIANDCVHLSSNNGVYLYQDLLAILAVLWVIRSYCSSLLLSFHLPLMHLLTRLLPLLRYTVRWCISSRSCPADAW